MAACSGQQLVLASDENGSWGTDAGGFERGILARFADFQVQRTGAVNNTAAISCQPSKYGRGQFGRVTMIAGVRGGAHPIVEHALRWLLRQIESTLVQKPITPSQPFRIQRM